MSTTCGFFNSMNKDRMYNATHFGHCFDGIILDGILAAIGDCFVVKAAGGMSITVGSGKAWYLASWLENDADLPMTHAVSDVILSRYDAVVMEFDATETVRWNDIKIVQGTASSDPEYPAMVNTKTKVQIPLAYVYIGANTSEITQKNITSVIGKDECPFVTSILQTVSLDTLLGQWEDELDQFVEGEQNSFTNWSEEKKTEILELLAQLNTLIEDDTVGELILEINRKLDTSGGDMTGAINMAGQKLHGLADPETDDEAATKKYVDSTRLGMDMANAVLQSSSWANSVQTVTVAGVLKDTTTCAVIVTAQPGSLETYLDCGVQCTAQGADKLTFTCKEVPTTALSVNVLILTKGG